MCLRFELGFGLGPSQLANIEYLDVEFQPLDCQFVLGQTEGGSLEGIA